MYVEVDGDVVGGLFDVFGILLLGVEYDVIVWEWLMVIGFVLLGVCGVGGVFIILCVFGKCVYFLIFVNYFVVICIIVCLMVFIICLFFNIG